MITFNANLTERYRKNYAEMRSVLGIQPEADIFGNDINYAYRTLFLVLLNLLFNSKKSMFIIFVFHFFYTLTT